MASAPAPGNDSRLGDDDVAKLDRLREAYGRLRDELGRVIIGQKETIERLAITMTEPAMAPIAAASPQPSASIQPTRMPTRRAERGL